MRRANVLCGWRLLTLMPPTEWARHLSPEELSLCTNWFSRAVADEADEQVY